MKRVLLPLILGILIGAAGSAGLAWTSFPKMMLSVHQSKLGFDETVDAIEAAAKAKGWKVPKVYDIQKSLIDAGQGDVKRIKILSICQPAHAYEILKEDSNKPVTAIMPCRIGVYEASDGSVRISSMNIGLMSKLFGGTIERVMTTVAGQEREMLAGIVAAE